MAAKKRHRCVENNVDRQVQDTPPRPKRHRKAVDQNDPENAESKTLTSTAQLDNNDVDGRGINEIAHAKPTCGTRFRISEEVAGSVDAVHLSSRALDAHKDVVVDEGAIDKQAVHLEHLNEKEQEYQSKGFKGEPETGQHPEEDTSTSPKTPTASITTTSPTTPQNMSIDQTSSSPGQYPIPGQYPRSPHTPKAAHEPSSPRTPPPIGGHARPRTPRSIIVPRRFPASPSPW